MTNDHVQPLTKPKYAARMLALGLTAYGQTEEEARSKLVKMLLSDVQAHLQVETATNWLHKTGLTTLESYDGKDWKLEEASDLQAAEQRAEAAERERTEWRDNANALALLRKDLLRERDEARVQAEVLRDAVLEAIPVIRDVAHSGLASNSQDRLFWQIGGLEKALAQNPGTLLADLKASSPDDLRADGWSVAVHNDYHQDGKAFTFWGLNRGGTFVNGEGATDADALNQIRKALGKGE